MVKKKKFERNALCILTENETLFVNMKGASGWSIWKKQSPFFLEKRVNSSEQKRHNSDRSEWKEIKNLSKAEMENVITLRKCQLHKRSHVNTNIQYTYSYVYAHRQNDINTFKLIHRQQNICNCHAEVKDVGFNRMFLWEGLNIYTNLYLRSSVTRSNFK